MRRLLVDQWHGSIWRAIKNLWTIDRSRGPVKLKTACEAFPSQIAETWGLHGGESSALAAGNRCESTQHSCASLWNWTHRHTNTHSHPWLSHIKSAEDSIRMSLWEEKSFCSHLLFIKVPPPVVLLIWQSQKPYDLMQRQYFCKHKDNVDVAAHHCCV